MKRLVLPLHTFSGGSAALILGLGLSACGTGDDPPSPSLAVSSGFTVGAIQPGATPFISLVTLNGRGAALTTVAYTIEPKAGSVSRPVHVEYAVAALSRKGYVAADGGSVTLPVYGLYAGYANQLSAQLQFKDGSVTNLAISITTPSYTDPNGIYDQPSVLRPRAAGSALGFDFFVLKSGLGTPVVVDTDGALRWVGVGMSNSESAAIVGDEFVIGDAAAPTVYTLGFDGTLSQGLVQSGTYTNFAHNIDPGKNGLLADVDTVVNGVVNHESTLSEITQQGAVFAQWDLAAIIEAYMQSQGDDPSAFVRPGADWFHLNSSTYDARDDSIIVSSRENFVVKIDYRTGAIIWILGDPTKYWYTFPSLRAKP
jgi:hypothetical protein